MHNGEGPWTVGKATDKPRTECDGHWPNFCSFCEDFIFGDRVGFGFGIVFGLFLGVLWTKKV